MRQLLGLALLAAGCATGTPGTPDAGLDPAKVAAARAAARKAWVVTQTTATAACRKPDADPDRCATLANACEIYKSMNLLTSADPAVQAVACR